MSLESDWLEFKPKVVEFLESLRHGPENCSNAPPEDCLCFVQEMGRKLLSEIMCSELMEEEDDGSEKDS